MNNDSRDEPIELDVGSLLGLNQLAKIATNQKETPADAGRILSKVGAEPIDAPSGAARLLSKIGGEPDNTQAARLLSKIGGEPQ